MGDELKPCPFCGGEARAFYSEEGGTFDVQCQRCGAIPFIGSRTSEIRTLDGVIAAWNARAERTCGEYRGDVYDTPDGTSDDIELWCEHCDIPLEDGWRHCPNCGAKVVG